MWSQSAPECPMGISAVHPDLLGLPRSIRMQTEVPQGTTSHQEHPGAFKSTHGHPEAFKSTQQRPESSRAIKGDQGRTPNTLTPQRIIDFQVKPNDLSARGRGTGLHPHGLHTRMGGGRGGGTYQHWGVGEGMSRSHMPQPCRAGWHANCPSSLIPTSFQFFGLGSQVHLIMSTPQLR